MLAHANTVLLRRRGGVWSTLSKGRVGGTGGGDSTLVMIEVSSLDVVFNEGQDLLSQGHQERASSARPSNFIMAWFLGPREVTQAIEINTETC